MNYKNITIILGMIFLIGIVSATNSLDNLQGITVPLTPVVAGDSFTANFSFNYLEDGVNTDNSPLAINLTINSSDEDYPVWKGDFEMNGYVIKCTWTIFGTCVLPKTVPFSCSEISPYVINHTIDYQEINTIPNGTFYCFNKTADLRLNEHDEVFLDITSHPALWPGQYQLTARLFYMNDTTNPIVVILDDEYFNQYFRDGSYVDFNVRIYDGSGLNNYNAKVITSLGNISFSKEETSEEEIYHFYQTLPTTVPEGNWELIVTAQDTSGNTGSDSTILKIDRTAPEIKLISPANNSIVSDIIPLKVNVTDAKSGPNYDEVYYRLREIVNGTICPEIGVPLGNFSCTRTDWINLLYNSTTKLNEEEVNTTELNLTSGSYWLDIKAEDMLGNENYLM